MTSLKLLSVVLALAAATALTVGSVGFSSATADRGVSVNVVEDEEATVNVEACYTSANPNQGNRTPVTVQVTNRFPTALTVERVDGESPPPGKATVSPGGRTTFTVTPETAVSEVTVDLVSDGGTQVTITRTVVEKADCPFEPADGTTGDGETGPEANETDGDGTDGNGTVDDGVDGDREASDDGETVRLVRRR